jgi:hypothetical protein
MREVPDFSRPVLSTGTTFYGSVGVGLAMSAQSCGMGLGSENEWSVEVVAEIGTICEVFTSQLRMRARIHAVGWC